jgi:hypothetical protein
MKETKVIFDGENKKVILTKEVKFSENPIFPTEEKYNMDELDKLVHIILQKRKEECLSSLEHNIQKATFVNSCYVMWNGGHFTLLVLEEIEAASNFHVEDFNRLQCQQAIRMMFDMAKSGEYSKYAYFDNLFRYLTERLVQIVQI